jgi:hypothetical protein
VHVVERLLGLTDVLVVVVSPVETISAHLRGGGMSFLEFLGSEDLLRELVPFLEPGAALLEFTKLNKSHSIATRILAINLADKIQKPQNKCFWRIFACSITNGTELYLIT